MHPYKGIAPSQHWIRGVAEVPASEIDPMGEAPFRIGPQDKVATAGSCFAQHIARHLAASGFNYFVAEAMHPAMVHPMMERPERFNYGTFSARYGNIYTTRQLIQLARRAYGEFEPVDSIWETPDGRFVDAFRPQIQPGGFHCEDELLADRHQHFAAVRDVIEHADVFVFTLGLTECFVSRADGAVYPVAPGVSGGTYDAERYEFKNFGVSEVVADLSSFISFLRARNPACRFILTVSPVPLMATAENRHVLCSTTYSKSVLRVACDEVERATEGLVYFPSYEIITGAFNRGAYFADDLREVKPEGVAHVMKVFMRHFAKPQTGAGAQRPAAAADAHTARMQALSDLACEEEVLRNV